jgi:hypothetical protein
MTGKIADCLQHLRCDIIEAIAADELLYVIEYHINNSPNGRVRGLDPGFEYVVGALVLRMALAINRLFENAGRDRANFDHLERLVAKQSEFAAALNDTFKKVAELRRSPDFVRLKNCRDGFMAHTLRGPLGHRDGIQNPLLSLALENAERVFEDVHRELMGDNADLAASRKKWRQRAQEFWRNRLPEVG